MKDISIVSRGGRTAGRRGVVVGEEPGPRHAAEVIVRGDPREAVQVRADPLPASRSAYVGVPVLVLVQVQVQRRRSTRTASPLPRGLS
jgi:hypothetical protein